ncbi:hypothetical protein DFQ27_001668 [Actinomortierella ambigua]|uniref:Zn(2)-C6 fungal-type domain-containing protein n=1 Tax=Actinomortierella ambigua TaxID=1343610 RepID=A0A9P6Q9N9_9FUNG|nr:hypothetical protein DFQ27_001668 [Actinomortierella ambigua]
MTKIKPRLIARISCQECRRRKTRCNFDGQSQKCSTCARIGTPCIFSQKNGTILDIDKVIEENNPHLAYQREKEQRARERAASFSTSSPSTSFLSNAAAIGHGQPAAVAADQGTRPSRSNSLSVLKGRSSPTDELTSVMDRLQIDAFGIAPHTLRSFSQVVGDNDSTSTTPGGSMPSSDTERDHDDETAPNAGLAASVGPTPPPQASLAMPHLLHDPDSINPDVKSTLYHKRRSGSAGSTSTSKSKSSRNKESAIGIDMELIDLYFKHVHPYLLILHKPSFFRRLHDPKDPVPDFLLAAMYAVASNYSTSGHNGKRYLDFWLSRLDATMDKPRLSTIQALLMIIKYHEGVRQTGFYFRTYMYTQMVIVLARELQLHKATPVNIKLDQESHEVRRRLFWAVFVLDQFISVSQGRTMNFREVEPEADMPQIDNEDPNDTEELETILNAVEYIKLSKINHQALILVRKFLTKVVTPEETIPQGMQLAQTAQQWKDNLPERLRLSSNNLPRTPYIAMLHLLYAMCVIMIQRCYCEDPTISHLEIATTSRISCINNANLVTVMTDEIYSKYGMLPLNYPIRGCYFVIYCLIVAATIQYNDLRRGGRNLIVFKRTLALVNIILRSSAAIDIEKEVDLLKTSMEASTHTPVSLPAALLSHNPHPHGFSPYDRPLKPILPAPQRHGSKAAPLYASSSMTSPVRIRKISPKSVSSPAASKPCPADTATAIGTSRDSSLTSPTLVPASSMTNNTKPINQSANDMSPPLSVQDHPSPAYESEERQRSQSVEMDMETPCQAAVTTAAGILGSIPAFTAPQSLPPDFSAFAMAQQQALAAGQATQSLPLSSLGQLLAFQEQQRLQHAQQKQTTPAQSLAEQRLLASSLSAQSNSLDQLTAAEIREQHRLNQQHQQQEFLSRNNATATAATSQPMPAAPTSQPMTTGGGNDAFLSNFANLYHYQQINSDQAQQELISLLSGGPLFPYPGAMNGGDSIPPFAMQQQQQQQQPQQQVSNNHEGLSPSSLSSGFSQTTFHSPPTAPLFSGFSNRNRALSADSDSSMTEGPTVGSIQQCQQHQQSMATKQPTEGAFYKSVLENTPSPDMYSQLDMAGSFQTYLAPEGSLPASMRQIIDETLNVDKILAGQRDGRAPTTLAPSATGAMHDSTDSAAAATSSNLFGVPSS